MVTYMYYPITPVSVSSYSLPLLVLTLLLYLSATADCLCICVLPLTTLLALVSSWTSTAVFELFCAGCTSYCSVLELEKYKVPCSIWS